LGPPKTSKTVDKLNWKILKYSFTVSPVCHEKNILLSNNN